MIKKSCEICSNNFFTHQCKINAGKGKYCSRKCYELSKRGKPSWNKGKPAPWAVGNQFKKGIKNPYLTALNKSRTGVKNYQWKGDNVGYYGLHAWIKKILGRPEICEFCHKTNLIGRKIHWANKSGKYLRDKEDWLRLCISCHGTYDKKNGLRKHKSNII